MPGRSHGRGVDFPLNLSRRVDDLLVKRRDPQVPASYLENPVLPRRGFRCGAQGSVSAWLASGDRSNGVGTKYLGIPSNTPAERMPISCLVHVDGEAAMFGGKTKFQSERLMADIYLGIMIAGVNTLIVLGAALAFVVI